MELTGSRPEVVVVGLGTMGAAAAYHLASRGVRVLGLDRFRPPHTRGEHAGGSRIIRQAYAEGRAYVPLVQRAYELWQQLSEVAGVELMTPTGGLMLGRADSAQVAGALASAQAHGLEHEMLDARTIRARFPAFAPDDDEIGLYERAAGVVRPEAAISAHLRLAEGWGADLRYGGAVTGWDADADGVTVHVDGATVSADRLIVCPGPWAADLLQMRGNPVTLQSRLQHYWLPSEPFAIGRCPVWIWEPADDAVAYGIPAFSPPADLHDLGPGVGAVVKAAFHSGDRPADAELGAPSATPDDLADVVAWLARRLPALADSEYLEAKACLYTMTPDEDFILGPHPEAANVAVAAGFSGHGFKFAPVVGEILADLAQTGHTLHTIDQFAPGRFTAKATGP
ncbi:N-methyl-L-tryptophan oxidase [Asanoa sp. WMMD1127]|uniref:N-methyl-L-tryptophan oxidase n=1 Tax=Asanoa sp. WMMD1127 TaxID=3016107 RepID=UPI002416930B|nr:N-methyl-L-tryptophan oxidase [Asanoa sp. WMMD1127]MDG4820335.1 N-methyl-L-tryptophan oxidase [Asanoa sp. WMMD1127]